MELDRGVTVDPAAENARRHPVRVFIEAHEASSSQGKSTGGCSDILARVVPHHKFAGAVPALLTSADGDSEHLADLVASFCAEVPNIVRALSRDVGAGNSQAVCRAAQNLQGRLSRFGVPDVSILAAAIEDLGRARDMGPAVPLVDELAVALDAFCAYLAKKPWIR